MKIMTKIFMCEYICAQGSGLYGSLWSVHCLTRCRTPKILLSSRLCIIWGLLLLFLIFLLSLIVAVVVVVVVVGMIHLDFFPFIYLFILCARATYKILQVHLAPSIVEVQMICHTFCLVMQMPQFSLDCSLTLLETNSLHLKMDGWNTSFLLVWPIFRGCVSFGEGNHDCYFRIRPQCRCHLTALLVPFFSKPAVGLIS